MKKEFKTKANYLGLLCLAALTLAVSACGEGFDPLKGGEYLPTVNDYSSDDSQARTKTSTEDEVESLSEVKLESPSENKSIREEDILEKQTQESVVSEAKLLEERIQERPVETVTDEKLDPEEVKADWDSQPKAKEWTKITLKALEGLGQNMVLMEPPSDTNKYCPRFGRLTYEQRLKFYVMLISAMARYESGFEPASTYTEDFTDDTGENVVSRGLLQMSIESAKGYGCKVSRAIELHDPETNLKCGVKVLDRWITKDKKFGSYGRSVNTGKETHLGASRYWAVLRRDDWGRSSIREKTANLEFCK